MKDAEHILKPKSKEEIETATKHLSDKKLVEMATSSNSSLVVLSYAIERGLSEEAISEVIKYVTKKNQPQIAEQIITKYPSINPAHNHNELFRWACNNGHESFVKMLMSDPRVDPSDLNNAALLGAKVYEHDNIVKLLKTDKRVQNKIRV